jgi:hypothetical protein
VTIGLDLGSYQFRSMRVAGDRLVARRCPAVFVSMSDTPAHRRLLQQSGTHFATCSDHLLVFGDAAREWSAMLNLSPSPLLRGGRIPASDPISRQVLTLMIDAILPPPAQSGALCKTTLPGAGYDERNASRDADFFLQLIALRGYQPEVLTATHALALAELTDVGFTGVTIMFGHSTCEFGISHCGRQLNRCVVMSGLDQFTDNRLLGSSDASDEKAVANLEREYRTLFASVIDEARSRFELDATLRTLPKSMPVVCSGGITGTPAFLPLFQQVWNEAHWPISTQPVRVSSSCDLAVARGCLIQAILEQPVQSEAA